MQGSGDIDSPRTPPRRARTVVRLVLCAAMTVSAGASLAQGLPEVVPQPLAPVSPAARTKTVLVLSAFFSEGGAPITSGIHWRIFSDQADINGNHPLIAETTDARPTLTLDPGGYVVHAVYGLAKTARHVVLGGSATSERIVLDVGAVRFSGLVGSEAVPDTDQAISVYTVTDGIEDMVAENVRGGELVRLPAGVYQITATYGTANAKVQSEIRVEPGRLTEAEIQHRAGRITLRLEDAGALAQAESVTWSVFTPGGDAVTTALEPETALVLSVGDYIAVAQYAGETFQQSFSVEPGDNETVVIAVPAGGQGG